MACQCAPRSAARLDTGRLGCVVVEGSAIAQLPTQNGPERSTLLECALRLIAQGLDKIRQRGSTRRLDEDVDRHAGHQLGRAELCQLLRLEQDAGGPCLHEL